MTGLNPAQTTAGDICKQALKDCGAIGQGQSPTAEDTSEAQMRLQWMLQEWERKSLLVYHLVTNGINPTTGATTYSIGPGGNIDTNQPFNPFNQQFNYQFGPAYPASARPAKIESAFLRQIQNTAPNQIDYPLRIIQTMNDYNRIALKSLQTFPGYLFYDPAWPLGVLYPWPVPQANIYAFYCTYLEQLPPMFATQSTVINLPFEYFNAMVLSLALRLRPKYGIVSFPGDPLPGLVKDAIATLRKANTRVTSLVMANDLLTGQQYNIFSDRMY